MLLYTRVAPPKVPKKRSRAGCNYCKEKKKKCDEVRPQCARCNERGQDCVYEPIKPRQRRKRDSVSNITLNSPSSVVDDGLYSPVSDAHFPYFGAHNQPYNHNPHRRESNASSLRSGFDLTTLSTKSLDSPLDTSSSFWSPTDAPSLDSRFDLSGYDEPNIDDDDVEEVIRNDSFTVSGPSHTSYNPSLALIAPCPLASPTFEFRAPAFAEFSEKTNRRVLVDHFCNVLSHLIVLREEDGNPFQQLVLPLCHKSDAVKDAIYALASAHLEYRGVKNQEKSVYFHNQAIQGLARLIEQGGDVNKNELLAAIMLLVYYEVLVQKGRSNIVDGHLKGAMTIMSNSGPRTDPTGVFLERAFRFYDVITALSFGTTPLSATGPGLVPFVPLDSRGATSPLGSVDTLLGMATTLWPIIHRLPNLLSFRDELDTALSNGESSKAAVLRNEFETTTTAIETALCEWQPVLPPDCDLDPDHPGDPSSSSPNNSGFSASGVNMTAANRARLQSILNNALAYQHSALVYLYRTIYAYPREHALVQRHTHVSLTHCAGTVTNEGPMGALLWPLFVAACEAVSPADRDITRRVFAALDRRQGMLNIDRAWRITQEVWRRADEAAAVWVETERATSTRRAAGAGRDLWRRVSEEMGVTIVFG